MAARSLKVEFLLSEAVAGAVSPAPQVHDITLPDSAVGVPQILENPHVDFPGTWSLVGDRADGAFQYQQVARVAESADTLAG